MYPLLNKHQQDTITAVHIQNIKMSHHPFAPPPHQRQIIQGEDTNGADTSYNPWGAIFLSTEHASGFKLTRNHGSSEDSVRDYNGMIRSIITWGLVPEDTVHLSHNCYYLT